MSSMTNIKDKLCAGMGELWALRYCNAGRQHCVWLPYKEVMPFKHNRFTQAQTLAKISRACTGSSLTVPAGNSRS